MGIEEQGHRLSIAAITHTRGDPWFDDGNIVLITHETPTAFKLHRGILARHSEIFRNMLEIPQPEAKVETYEGCQVVCMYDNPVELANLAKALYDGLNFQNRNLDDFFYLAGILRLANKYFIANLRACAIRFLAQTWSHTLEGHDNMVEAALSSPVVDELSYPYVHPLLVINLAREVNVKIVIPSAFYFLSLYSLAEFVKGDHPKLKPEHSSKPSAVLSASDLESYTTIYQYRLHIILHFIRDFCEHPDQPRCMSSNVCAGRFRRLQLQLSRSWSLKTGPLFFMIQAGREISRDQFICTNCSSQFHENLADLRKRIWEELPLVIGLPSWTEMEANDLPTELVL